MSSGSNNLLDLNDDDDDEIAFVMNAVVGSVLAYAMPLYSKQPHHTVPSTSHMQSLLSSVPAAPVPSPVSITPSNTSIPSSKRKHSALESSGSISTLSSAEASTGSKKARNSGTAALARIGDELRTFTNAYHMKAQMSQIAPAADDEAIGQAQDMLEQGDPDIGDDAILAIVDIFKTDVQSARTYVRFRRDSLRKRWVRRELQKMNLVLADEPAS